MTPLLSDANLYKVCISLITSIQYSMFITQKRNLTTYTSTTCTTKSFYKTINLSFLKNIRLIKRTLSNLHTISKFLTFKSKSSKLFLTPLLPAYKYIVLWNHALSWYFCTTLQLHNLPVGCVRELFKSSKDWASVLVSNEKKI